MNKRQENFKRIAPKRLTNVVKSLRLIGNLSNKRHYEYSKSDVDLIVETLRDEISTIVSQFNIAEVRNKKDKFKF